MKIAYCIKCGNKFPEEAVFCPYCGTKVYRPEDDVKPVVETKEKPTQVVEPVVAEPEPVVEAPVVTVEPEPEPVEELDEETIVVEEPASVEEALPVTEIVLETVEEVPVEELPAEEVPIEEETEDPNIGMCIISFFFPMIGFISAFFNIGSNKKKAKTYAMWAGIGMLLGFVSGMVQALI